MADRLLNELTKQWEPVIRRAFLNAVSRIRDRASINEIARFIQRGEIENALAVVGLNPVSFRPLDNAIHQTYEAAGVAVANKLPPMRTGAGKLVIEFDVRNIRAETWLREHSSRMVADIIADQRRLVREHLAAGMTAGDNPRTTAIELVGRLNKLTGRREGGAIGLTANQEDWVRRYKKELAENSSAALRRTMRDKRFDRSLIKAIREGTPLPADVRARMVLAYRARALQYRAEAIARTESIASLNSARIEAMQQAVDAGQVNNDAVTKIWHATRDPRTRDTHKEMDGQKIPFDAEGFTSPSGALIRFPGDPLAPPEESINCRCWVEVRIDHLKGIR